MGSAAPNQHVLLRLIVPRELIELASDALWACGAQALQEVSHDATSMLLLTDLGVDPLTQWTNFIDGHPSEAMFGAWPAAVTFVDAAVGNTWRDFAVVTRVDSVVIVPDWKRTEHSLNMNDNNNDNDTVIFVEPLGSFGIGDHPTTQATLHLALEVSQKYGLGPQDSVLDLGCGTGVLGIALAKRFGLQAVCIDLAPAAVESTTINIALNEVDQLVSVALGDVSTPTTKHELVLANILAPVLLDYAEAITSAVAPNGNLILSGFNESRINDITRRYEEIGMTFVARCDVDNWIAVSFRRSSSL